jgi:hypothetical protein
MKNVKIKQPVLYANYNRQQVHDMLAPDEPFTRSASKWGIQGILPVPDRPGDFVFFASLGQSTGGHTFDEGVSTEGILRWQSQRRQSLEDPVIQTLIAHDDSVNTIHFFLRTSNLIQGKARPYTYLGPLRYVSHDDQREAPVHFAWELVQWPIPHKVRATMGLVLDEEVARPIAPTKRQKASGLILIPAPPGRPVGEPTRTFQARKIRRKSDEESRAIGLAGEQLVMAYERKRLTAAGKPELAQQIEHVSFEVGDGAGYDIKSFEVDGSDLFIEVKTTTGIAGSPFYISANEVAFSAHAAQAFVIYRLASFDEKANSAVFYQLRGPVELSHKLVPTTFRAHALP